MQTKKLRITPLDIIILASILGFIAYITYRLFFSLNYNWNWDIILTYLVRFDQEEQRWVSNILLQGFITTIKLSIWSTLFAVIIGVTVGLMRVSPRLLFKLCGITYIESIRNTPPLVLIFIFYYFVSDQLLTWVGVEDYFRASSPQIQTALSWLFTTPGLITQFFSGVLTLGLFQGAYI